MTQSANVSAMSLSMKAPESPATLLVHLSPWGNPIYRHEKHLPGFDDAEQNLNIVEYVCKDLLLCDAEVYIFVIGVWTLMDDSIHIQI